MEGAREHSYRNIHKTRMKIPIKGSLTNYLQIHRINAFNIHHCIGKKSEQKLFIMVSQNYMMVN